MDAAEQIAPTIMEPLTWAKICERYPDEWGCVAPYVYERWVWFYYCDFIAESGLTAPILVGAVLELAAGVIGGGYAAARAPWPRVIGAVLVGFAA